MARITKNKLSAVAMLGGAFLGTWSISSFACSDSPILGSICVMAVPETWALSFNEYIQAAGQTLQVAQYPALYAVIGNTFGGQAPTTFKLPDLRSRVIVGAGPAYKGGTTGGNATIQLTRDQLPAQPVALSAAVDLSKVTASTTLSGLTATADLSGVSASGDATGLTMKVVSNNNNQPTPSNNYLGKNAGLTTSSYSNLTPDATLNSGAIAGTVSVKFSSGTSAPVTVSGSGTTTIGGAATVVGSTGNLGAGANISVMPPYMAMTYYIATTGLFPNRN